MWIFITAVFLVTVWLFYRWPKPTIKVVAVMLGVVAIALLWALHDQTESSKRWQAEEAARLSEIAKVRITPQYDLKNACQQDHPLQVFMTNGSSKTVVAVAWELEAYAPGHSSNLVPSGSGFYGSDAIVKPGFMQSWCYPLPKFEGTGLAPALLDLKIVRPQVTFASE